MQVQPYLFFDGRCEEAIEFYKTALNAEVTGLMRFKESPDTTMIPPGGADKVMHANFRIGETIAVINKTDSRQQEAFLMILDSVLRR